MRGGICIRLLRGGRPAGCHQHGPQRLDLLADPTRLVADRALPMSPDGYVLGYVLEA